MAGTDWTGNNALLVGLASVAERGFQDAPFRGWASWCPQEGVARLSGVLLAGRYVVYGPLPFHLQYRFAHLLRDVAALAKDFPDVPEFQVFCAALAGQLAATMRLHSSPHPDDLYYAQDSAAKSEIVRICTAEARHPGVQTIQGIFRENPHCLYHWADDRRVPADNNYSERSLRPLVIARKISFETQSELGSATRSVVMSVLHTLRTPQAGRLPRRKAPPGPRPPRPGPRRRHRRLPLPPARPAPAAQKWPRRDAGPPGPVEIGRASCRERV